ncbi:MAG: 50S ribosomal protein L34 [Patescibacteria group bacterium]
MPKRTYQPSTRRRSRRLGFMKKMSSATSRKMINRRRLHGRKKLTV